MIREWLGSLFELVFRPSCAVCGEGLLKGESTICTTCRWDMPLTDYWSMRENYLVERLAGRFPFVHASALMFFRHDSQYRSLIHRMKYSSRPDIAHSLGEIYGLYLSQSELYRDIEIVVGVPLHFTKRIKRGFNQSEEFARAVAQSMGVEYDHNSIRRIKRTQTQARLQSGEQRARNVEHAFRVVHPDRIAGRKILLVDDVITTGATIEAVALAITSQSPSTIISIGAIAVVKGSSTPRV